MQPESKKISFGFSKISKKPNVIFNKPIEEKKIELVECLEGQSIKIKDAVEVVEVPLIIPLKDDQKNLLDRIKNAKSKQKQAEAKKDDRPDSELTIDELAVREVIRDAQHRLSNKESNDANKVLTLPVKEDELPLDGEKESTLDDYESIPIGDFGMAMLRGMGWKEGMGIGKNASKVAAVSLPELRPKGLGLGASKLLNENSKAKTVDKEGKELILIKGGFAKIVAGPHKGYYCEVLGFDDEAGRVIVKTSIKPEILNLNEFMLLPISKDEFSKGSKVLNNAKYEEYKEKSDKRLENFKQNAIEAKNGNSSEKYTIKKEERDYSSEEDKYKQKSSKQRSNEHSSKQSEDSDDSENEKHTKKPSKKPEKLKDDSSSSEEEYKKRRNEKKTKSSRRDRSRSKNRKSKSRHRHKSSSSEEEYKKKSKKNKCKSRHRRNSSSEDRQYRKNRR